MKNNFDPNAIIEQDNIKYYLNFNEKTASIIGNTNAEGDIFIPRSIKYFLNEYLITSILEDSFTNSTIKSIQFASDSAVQTIEKNVFVESTIEFITIPSSLTKINEFTFYNCTYLQVVDFPDDSKLQIIEKNAFFDSAIVYLQIPSSVIELQDEWCSETPQLTEIEISPDNPYYKMYEDEMIIGKSTLESDNYDVLVFCVRDIENVTIPSFIKQISASAFAGCDQISIQIPDESELQIIGKYAFCKSSIESFTIPSTVTRICEGAFSYCNDLKSVIIPENSELKTIEKYAFCESPIESLKIPSKLIDLQRKWCIMTSKLKKITVSPNNPRYSVLNECMIIGKSSIELDDYDVFVFCARDIKSIIIPSFIKSIGPLAFCECKKLKKVEILKDSQLQTIDDNAFAYSSIETFTIPSQLINISKQAFAYCERLRRFEIPLNSKLQIIEKFTFSCSSIEYFTVPQNIIQINRCAFISCEHLRWIEFPPNSELKIIEQKVFYKSSIESISFPPHITKIGEEAFSYCIHLQIIEINENSDTNFINKNIFQYCNEALMMIPTKLGWLIY